MIGYILALVSGLLLSVAFWSELFWWLGFFGFTPILCVLLSPHRQRRIYSMTLVFAITLFSGIGFPAFSSFWPIEAGDYRFYGGPAFLFRLGVAFLVAISVLSFIVATILVLVLAAGRRLPFWTQALILFPFFWIVIDFLIRTLLFRLNWISLGFILVNSPSFRWLSYWGGIYILSALLAFFNGLLLLSFRKYSLGQYRSVSMIILAIVGMIVAPYLYARTLTTQPPQDLPTIAILQPDTAGEVPPPFANHKLFSDLFNYTKAKDAEIIVFPSHLLYRTVSINELSPQFFSKLFGSFAEDSRYILVTTLSIREENKVYSTMLAVRGGEVIGKYYKQYLMPFSDYTPTLVGSLLRSRPGSDFTPFQRSKNGFLSQAFGLGAVNCSEVFISSVADEQIRLGAEMLLETGSDGYFSNSLISRHTLRASQLFAAQHQKWIIRGMKKGISAIIDPKGDVHAFLSRNSRGVLIFDPANFIALQ